MNSTIQVIIIYVVVLGVMLLLSYFINKKKREKQQHDEYFKVGDKVMTIGESSEGKIVARS